ncbi:glycerophosphoryl diester phosphodiesterase [Novosphingobium kunmingense]|uniref:Glycerophosphoryl diester phosphodiesterase n=1 Tax=Novosphingobium kunmingense TaxID=1211806 RepID=A0A2N0H5R7_9SPHN|nr:glycerophosphodiester phosphodiesterase family protein [Novosphingobium kunmingense]PKB14260.1 glycerophosphoryl diester phosphodiesterase [Novosphingobium kunmingense]
MSLFALLDNWRAPPPAPARVGWLAGVTYAHRGLHGAGVPENSPSAFAAAIARGMGIECDVQRSYEGQAVVFHDATLDRLTAESGPVAARSSAELGQIVLSGGTDTIPTLRKVLDQVAGQVPLLIEIKSKGNTRSRVAALCLAVRRVIEGYGGAHAIMSFDPRVVRWFADRSPHTVRGLVVTEENDKALPGMIRRRLALWYARPDFLAYDVRDLPSRFAAAQKARGLPLLTWTVRDADLAERAATCADAAIAEGAGVA